MTNRPSHPRFARRACSALLAAAALALLGPNLRAEVVTNDMDLTLINNFYIIGNATAPNFLVHFTGHVTVNADGTVTANTVNASMRCH